MARVSRKAVTAEAVKPLLAVMPERVYHAAVYVRLSVEDNRRTDDKESIATQQYMLEKYIEGQPDMKLQGVYCDNGETGTDFARPGFEHMMDKVRDREVDCIVVKDLSRFGRNYVETGYYLEKIFPRLGVRFVAVNDSYDTLRDKDDKMVLSLKNLVNDLYAKDISQKVVSSLDIKRKSGEYIGSVPPYGYRKSLKDKHKLVIDPDAASVMRSIFQWRADGTGIVQIVQKLNEEEIPGPALYRYEKGYTSRKPSEAGGLWKAQGVRRMLGNIVYAGHMAQGKTKKSLGEGISKRNVPCDEWIIVKNTHPPVVDQETFDRVQELMKECCCQSLAIRGKHETAENIFKGLLVCADCGRKMVRRKNVDTKKCARYAFVCSVYEQNRGRRGCTKKYVREQDIQNAVLESLCLLMETVPDRERLPGQMPKQGVISRQREGLGDKAGSIQQKMKRNTALRSTLYESFCDGTLTKAEYLSLKKEYDQKAQELDGELAGFLQKDQAYKSRLSSWEEWLVSLRGYRSSQEGKTGISGGCREEKPITRKMALEMIQSIRVSGYNELEIVWSFQDEFIRMADMAARHKACRKGAHG